MRCGGPRGADDHGFPVPLPVWQDSGPGLAGRSQDWRQRPVARCDRRGSGIEEQDDVEASVGRHSALALLAQALPSLGTALHGIQNEGMLALQELDNGAPLRPDLQQTCDKAKKHSRS